MAMAKVCPVYIKERKLRELMTEFNCSYKRALTLYVPPSPAPVDTISQNPLLFTPDREKSLDMQIPPAEQPENATYATVTSKNTASTTQKKTVENGKKKTKRRKILEQEKNEQQGIQLDDMSENSDDEDHLTQEERSQYKEQISWQLLFNKLKRKMLEEDGGSWSNKITSCASIILEGILSFIMQYTTDWPCLNFIKQLWTATTHTVP
jgi:hypothetical protein